MHRGGTLRAIFLAGGAALALSGCVAAAIPVAAAGGIYRSQQERAKSRDSKRERAAPAPQPGQVFTTEDGQRVELTGLRQLPPPDGTAPAPTRRAAKAPPEMQYLYGSGEAAALSIQAYHALATFLRNEIGYRRDKTQIRSVVLAPGSTLAAPRFDLCGPRPLALVLDVDETVLLNLGYEADAAERGGGYDAARWARWEQTGADKVAAVPGAPEALAEARRQGITVIFNTNRSAASAAQTRAAIEGAGLGPAVPGETLWLRGDDAGSGKDARRQEIARRYCIVAMAGDQLGDFSDLFNAADLGVPARRASAAAPALAALWGAGWFLLPNPVYGTGLKGGLDDIFPPERRWVDPQEKK